MSSSVWNFTAGFPGELNLVSVDICALCLSVDTFDAVLVGEVPATLSLWLVEAEVAFEVWTVRIEPLAANKLSVLEVADVLLSRLEEDVSALSILLSIGPVARVDIFIQVGHDAFTVSVSIFPVPVIFTNLSIHLFADTVLLVVLPCALVCNRVCVFSTHWCIGVVSLSMTNLLSIKVIRGSVTECDRMLLRLKLFSITYAFKEISSVGVTVGVLSCTFASIVSRCCLSVSV